MSRLHVVHTTSFTYGGAVTASYNEARMTPPTEARQTVLEASLSIQPHSWRHDYRDYWGTAVTAFESSAPHSELVITATARVDVTSPPSGPAADWNTLRGAAVTSAMAEFLVTTTTTAVPPELAETAEELSAGREPDDAAREICAALRDVVEYVPGVTAVHSAATEAWQTRKGVCQDMAHLSVGALRSVGIPARYVSGYLYPARDGEVGQTVVGESHAWVEWWAGRWVGYDPTNRVEEGERHVVIARGREYNDVPPLRGIFAGSTTESHDVTVRITREA